ncbi:MAG: hypothetical protein EBT45_08115 [Alphaproteobacteria bacterium]|nr:hypothetical protein [Alphaproteobacteria bacterium]
MKHLTDSHLKKKRKELIDQLYHVKSDMLRGSLIKKYRKCGKLNCHCVEGQAHISYYLSVSVPKVKPIMIYVSLNSKAMVERALSNYHEAQKIMEELSDINRELLRRKQLL